MNLISDYFTDQVNAGTWLTGYTLPELLERVESSKLVLPICSMGTPFAQLSSLAPLVLPPLYHEAMDSKLKSEILDRIHCCFPFYRDSTKHKVTQASLEIVELPVRELNHPNTSPKVLGFSVDTAVEEHGPHLPLATDTIQSYAVLRAVQREFDGFELGFPVDYGHLTWGLPFGLSIDLTPPLVAEYVTGFANAVQQWLQPEAMYVVDVHGSIVHRTAIQDGMKQSRVDRWSFRWLHEPLVEFAGDRGDQHAGGVETALIEHINADLTDQRWWPQHVDRLADGQMTMDQAVELSSDLSQFIEHVESHSSNGIVGDVRNYYNLDASTLMERMLNVARQDVALLLTNR